MYIVWGYMQDNDDMPLARNATHHYNIYYWYVHMFDALMGTITGKYRSGVKWV